MGMKKQNNTPREKNKEEWEGFDDCPICLAMKSGEVSTMRGLMNAFEKARRSDKGVVGIN
jgi:hypothetical protein